MTVPADGTSGRLVIVGTGIRTVGQLTVEAIAWMKAADHVFHLVADEVARQLIESWQPHSNADLGRHYTDGLRRRDAYDLMVAEVCDAVRSGRTVCAAFYGHPGIFAEPPHRMVSILRSEGLRADMLPAVSAEDCLFADLGVDPASGCHSYEATNFVMFDHRSDPSVHLILWQIGMLGDWTHQGRRDVSRNVSVLVDKLVQWYDEDHPVTVYQAAVNLDQPHRAQRLRLRDLPTARLTSGCTLYVPPAVAHASDPVFNDRLLRVR